MEEKYSRSYAEVQRMSTETGETGKEDKRESTEKQSKTVLKQTKKTIDKILLKFSKFFI